MANRPYHGLFSDPFSNLYLFQVIFQPWPGLKFRQLRGHGIRPEWKKGHLNILNHPKKVHDRRIARVASGGDNISQKSSKSWNVRFLLGRSSYCLIAEILQNCQVGIGQAHLSIDSQVARTKTPRPADLLRRWSQKPQIPIPYQKYGIFAYILPYFYHQTQRNVG